MTEQDLIIQNLRRENEALRAALEWKDKEIELAQRHEMRWISVEDRLPDQLDDSNYVKCLAYLPYYDAIKVGEYSFGENCWRSGGLKETVTHWLPLPEKPEAVNDG